MSVWYPEARVVLSAVFDGFGPPRDAPMAFPSIPRSIEIVRNGYEQPDSWTIEFDQEDLPISPELFRAAGAEIYLYDKGALAVELGAVTGSPVRQDSSGLVNPFVGHEPQISGLADSIEVEMTDGGRRVSISGQDYTALFSEKGWRTDSKGHPDPIPVGLRIDNVLRQLMGEVDVTNRMTFDLRLPPGFKLGDLPVVGSATTRVIRDGFHAAAGTSYWAVMSKMAAAHGMLLYIENTKLVLTVSGNVYRASESVYEVEWGRNLESLSLERKLGRELAPQIEVRAYDDRLKETLIVRYPPEDTNTGKKLPKAPARLKQTIKQGPKSPASRPTALGTIREERKVFNLYGIRDKTIMLAFAKGAHDLMGRGEYKVSFTTRDLIDRRGLKFLDMRAGAAVQPRFDPLWLEMRRLDAAGRAAFLRGKGMPADVAGMIATNYDRIVAFQDAMYLREARLSWNAEDGLTIDGELVNFITPAREAA